MKRKKTELATEDSIECVPVSEVKKKMKKKKKKDDIDDKVNGTEACEAVSEVKKKKKKVKREKDQNVDIAESTELIESCMNEELVGKKKKKNKRVTTENNGREEKKGLENEEEEEELRPEEKRVLERKLKKLRKKEKKQQKEMVVSEKEDSKGSIAQTQALEYLTCWSEKRDKWKFQKTRQVWLLQHMFDIDKVPDTHFSVLLSYLEGLRGVAREVTSQKAETLVRFGAGPEDGVGGALDAQKKTQRAREVTQILS